MTKWTGTVRRVEFGPGGWELVAATGSCFELTGVVDEVLEGQSVVVEGRLEAANGFLMTGNPSIHVFEVTLAEE